MEEFFSEENTELLAFCNYFSRFLNLQHRIRGLQAKNAVEMGDDPESERRTCSLEKNGERRRGRL